MYIYCLWSKGILSSPFLTGPYVGSPNDGPVFAPDDFPDTIQTWYLGTQTRNLLVSDRQEVYKKKLNKNKSKKERKKVLNVQV